MILIVLLVILGAVLLVFFIRDNNKDIIKRKTGYSIPDYCKIEKFVKYGSIFNRKRFEAKVSIDNADHLEETIVTLQGMLGDDYHEIPLSEYKITKYSLFSEQKLIPNPVEISWVIVGPIRSGTLVCFLDIEEEEGARVFYMYMYYDE